MTTFINESGRYSLQRGNNTNSIFIPQPFLNYSGLTKMLRSDYRYIPKNPIYETEKQEIVEENKNGFENTLFQSNLNKNESQQNIDNNQEDETSGFWKKNMYSSNMYRSFNKGNNPWARSSAFTQKIQNTRGAYIFNQNAFDSPFGKNEEEKKSAEELEREREEAEKKAKEEEELRKRILGAQIGVGGVRNDTSQKILQCCMKKGWLGFSFLKLFLLENNRNDIIDKNTFRILTKKQGILLEDEDIDSICEAYDKDKSDYFNFIQFLNAIRNVSNTRGSQIESFKDQMKAPGQNYILLSTLLGSADMNYHPEAIKFVKSVPDLKKEYELYWEKIAKDGMISEDSFRQFLYDVSTCITKDEDFIQIIKALGYK